ncbi:MAG TPA: SUMF1/EgtB/PvdO family nonheme iron enzyme [Candidatus Polarisedimenticolia bacterium]|nr:SUMF1/EgtB/PvdO family nonheme iron enzyme [Candidatus Polarisedimenticolia bacterium]
MEETRQSPAPASPAAELARARCRTDAIWPLLRPEALLDRPIPHRHRFLFYLGHLEAFDWNLLGEGAVDPGLDSLFAFGIDPDGGELPSDLPSDWPSPATVARYARRARAAVDERLESASLDWVRLHAAIEHRLMHAETLAYMLRRLPVGRLSAAARGEDPPAAAGPFRTDGRAAIPAGAATLGQPPGSGAFGWDNERPAHRVWVEPFQIDVHDVTHRGFLRFVEEGGYQERSLWSDHGWEWIRSHGIRHPASWTPTARGWLWRGAFGVRPLPPDLPVWVSFAEASAYARWAGGRLPTEAEYHRAAFGTPWGEEREHPWGGSPPSARFGVFDFERWDPLPVGSRPGGDSAFGVADMVGNGWEWTSTPFAPFEGFAPSSFYPGYSADFFARDGRPPHRVLKGAGVRTAARLLRSSYRNWFQPHYPWVEGTFRTVEGTP